MIPEIQSPLALFLAVVLTLPLIVLVGRVVFRDAHLDPPATLPEASPDAPVDWLDEMPAPVLILQVMPVNWVLRTLIVLLATGPAIFSAYLLL